MTADTSNQLPRLIHVFACRNHTTTSIISPRFLLPLFFSSAGRFTDLPSNMTVKEGQNIEMACAFQSGTASVYLEIQWWFLKAPEPTDSEEDVDAGEVQGTFYYPYTPPPTSSLTPSRAVVLSTPTHRKKKGIQQVSALLRTRSDIGCVCEVAPSPPFPDNSVKALEAELFVEKVLTRSNML